MQSICEKFGSEHYLGIYSFIPSLIHSFAEVSLELSRGDAYYRRSALVCSGLVCFESASGLIVTLAFDLSSKGSGCMLPQQVPFDILNCLLSLSFSFWRAAASPRGGAFPIPVISLVGRPVE
jgi:hypothetical protein